MEMFCYQCQEASKNTGCTKIGVCGKDSETSNLQDVLVHQLKGLALYAQRAREIKLQNNAASLIMDALFVTVTNVNFDSEAIIAWIKKVNSKIDELKAEIKNAGESVDDINHNSVKILEIFSQDAQFGVLSTKNEDVRSLRELLIYGIKGIAAYAHHAAVLGKKDEAISAFVIDALASTTIDLSTDEMIALVLKAGETAVSVMALLDSANTGAFGNPEITTVNLGVQNNPGILISGHDLGDLEQLLEQTKATGVDVYTHSEMLPAHYYPAFKKYDNFVGNYGGAWYDQKKEFAAFNGPILMTTNCIVPPKQEYLSRFFTTGVAGYPGAKHIDADENGKKDFSGIIKLARQCQPPEKLEEGTITGGFAHNQVLALAPQILEAIENGGIKKFVVMAGCDGRHKKREYFTQVAEKLPEDTIILTAGCAKFRYNKLKLGDIGGIPRVLDAGQCNDSYSLALVALKLKEIFKLDDINDLPIEFDIAWYEQKAVTVLLALLYLGFKGIRLGPTLPAFVSPGVLNVLVENFAVRPIGEVEDDVISITG